MSNCVATLFQRLSQGVYVVGVAHGEMRNAFTAAWVMQVSFDLLLLALSINPHHSSYGLLKRAQAFSVNVLKKDQLELAAHYGARAGPDKLALGEWTTDRTGCPCCLNVWPGSNAKWSVNTRPATTRAGAGKGNQWQTVGFESRTPAYRETGAMDDASALFPHTFGD